MKVIDLLKKIENGENIPKKIKVYQEVFEWDILEHYYKRSNGDDLLELCTIFNTGELLSMEVELIEDEIDIDSIEKLDKNGTFINRKVNDQKIIDIQNKINELVQAVKQLNKKVKELKEEMYNENDNL
jgi:hypothetical protein